MKHSGYGGNRRYNKGSARSRRSMQRIWKATAKIGRLNESEEKNG